MTDNDTKLSPEEMERATKNSMAAALRGDSSSYDDEEEYNRLREEEARNQIREDEEDDNSVDSRISQKSFSKMTMADFMRQLQGGGTTKKKKPVAPQALEDATRFVARSGLTIRKGPALTSNEMSASRIVVRKEDRGESARDIQRTRKRAVRALTLKLSTPRYEEVLSGTKELDLADYSNNWQQATEGFFEWAQRYDALDIFKIPDVFDINNSNSILGCTQWTNIIKQFDDVPLLDVKEWQIFLNRFSGPLDRQSSDWAVDVLKLSTEKVLLSQVTQDYNRLPSEERGACTFYKMIVSRIVIRTHEAKVALQTYITNFDIRNFDGENVSMAVMRIKAVLTSLQEKDIPSNALTKITKGFSVASQEDFKNLCIAQTAQFATPLYKMAFDKYSISQQIYVTLDTFETKYQEILTANEWTGVGKEASAFKLELSGDTPNTGNFRKPFKKQEFKADSQRRDQKQRYASKEEWLANQTCRGCKKKGHFWRDCPAEEQKRRSAIKKLGIKDKGARKIFMSVIDDLVDMRVNQAMAEDDEEDEAYSTSGDEDEGSASDGADSDVEDEDAFQAHAARAFSSLKE